MAVTIIVELPGMDEKAYDSVMKEMGMDKKPGKWPKGIRSHVAGKTPEGWFVVDVWDSEEDFAKFRDSRLGPAFGKLGITVKPRVKAVKIHNHWTAK